MTLVLIGAILWYLGGIGEVGKLMSRFNPLFIVFILLLNTFDRGLMTYKWGRLLQGRGIRLPFLYGMKIYCASMIWGMFLPATVGADAIRAYSTSKFGLNSNEVVASIIIERMIGFLSALFLGLLSLILLSVLGILDDRFKVVWWAGAGLLGMALVGFVFSFSKSVYEFLYDRILSKFQETRIVKRFKQFHSVYLTYQDDKKTLLIFFALTFGEQWLPILNSWLLAKGMGLDIGLIVLAGIVPLTILISRIPIAISGLGIYDGIFMLLLSLAGISPAWAIAITLSGRIFQIASSLPWWGAHVIGIGSFQPPRLLEKRTLGNP